MSQDPAMDKVRTMGHRIAKGALLAIGLPYALVIVTNVVYGWPCSKEGEDKYKRALHPKRVLKVSYAIAEQVDLLKFLPLYMKWSSHYRSADNLVKDIAYGINNNTLDVWTPMKSPTQNDQSSPYSQLQSSRDSSTGSGYPVVVFVYGGAWGSGDKSMYGLLAHQLIQHLGATVVIPNYSIYPKGTVKDMIRDLHDTIAFIQSSHFNQLAPYANQQEVILFGHSAGAHLCALSAIDLVERLQHGGAAKSDQQSSLNNSNISSDHTGGIEGEESHVVGLDQNGKGASTDSIREEDLLLEQGTVDNSSQSHVVSDNEDRSPLIAADSLLSSIKGVVGLGGVYHIMDHYHHEARRGVEDLSPMWRAMEGLERFQDASPSARVLGMSREQAQRLPHMVLIHGTEDHIVPPSSTEKFASALADVEGAVTVKMIAEGGHAQLVLDLMYDGRKFHHIMVGLMKEAMATIGAAIPS